MAEPNLQEIHDFFVVLAKKAGGLVIAARPSAANSGRKVNAVDVVTETDLAVEKLVAESLREKYPSYRLVDLSMRSGLSLRRFTYALLCTLSFLGEETYDPAVPLSSDPTFVCDPIDGTTNFVHAFPTVCISLAFVIDKRSVVGVVYNPFLDILHTAIRGRGSYRNLTTRLPLDQNPSPLTGLGNALVAVEWGQDRSGVNYDVKRQTLLNLVAAKELGGAMVQGLRMLGSAALNLCSIAAGELDVYWEGGPWAWDFAAGMLILEEAGGMFVGAHPGNWEPALDGRTVLAVRAAPAGQKEIIEEFWSHVVGKFDYQP
ncbi:MAG: hypothetical protein M1839_003766 [Geoglossum umbratile]|nr:MAG: hypothetical protein M1839_003766 [Geoglossum umbratile]